MDARMAVQCAGSVTTSMVGWRFGWETGCWAGRLAATRAGSGPADMVMGMVTWRDGSNFISLVDCEVD